VGSLGQLVSWKLKRTGELEIEPGSGTADESPGICKGLSL